MNDLVLELETKKSSEGNQLLNSQSKFKTLWKGGQHFKAPSRNMLKAKSEGQNEITCSITIRRCARS
jgi:hypothetical protein